MSVPVVAGRSGTTSLFSVRSAFQRRLHQPLRRQSTKTETKSQTARTSNDSNTIPGAGWAWIEPLKTPFYAYGKMQHRSPYLTQLSSTLIIYFLGDLSAQLVSGPSAPQDSEMDSEKRIPYEPARGLRALVIGGIISIPNYKWFIFLGNHFNYSSHAVSIGVKILVNQTFFTPCFNTYFFGMQSLLSGSTVAEEKQRVIDTVPTSWKNSWKVWPAVTAFSFTFILPQYRSVFAGIIAIGWQTYLSWLNLRAAEEERRKIGLIKA